MYQALYRKWRPQRFSDVVGQTAITDTLKAQVESGRLSHAYLFSGSHGTGKTTCAKILAKAVNCEHPIHGDPCNECASCRGIDDGSVMDVIEIDAASNNGVDDVRELRDEAVYSPAQVKKRVYIIDEVHMFSNQAFNAILKIMEEPPAHVLFILATTEQHKVLPTVLSRCQRFTFKRITADTIARRLEYVAREEKLDCTPGVLPLVARLANGGMRDALSILDQCASGADGQITEDTVADVIGLATSEAMYRMIRAVAHGDAETALTVLSDIYDSGRDLVSVLGELNTYLRDLLVQKAAPNANLACLSARYDMATFAECASLFTAQELTRGLDIIADTLFRISGSLNRRIDAELCLIRLCNPVEVVAEQPVVKKRPAEVKQAEPKPEPIVEQKPEPKPEPIAEVKSAPAVVDAQGLWKTVLETAQLGPGMAVLFRDAVPTMEDGRLTLAVENPMTRNMMKSSQYRQALEAAATAAYGTSVQITVTEPKKDTSNPALEALCRELAANPNINFTIE